MTNNKEQEQEYIANDTKPRLKIVILVPHYWGKGDTIKEAWAQVAIASCKTLRELKKGRYRINVVPETDAFKAYVDDMGTLTWADVDGMRNLVIEQK